MLLALRSASDMRESLLLIGSAVSLGFLCTPLSAKVANAERVAQLARKAMNDTGAKGLAVAVVAGGRVNSVQSFGFRNAKGDPLEPTTVMYGASLTKTVFAYYALMLADEGKLKLDQPVASLLPKPIPTYGNLDDYGNWGDLSDDPRWKNITPRNVLTHSAGFANFSSLEPDGKLRIHFNPGSRFSYSGEGIELLQFGLEQGLGLNTQTELDRRIFRPLGMHSTSLIWRNDFAKNLADGWTLEGKSVPHDERSTVRAAGSMDTTPSDLAKFVAAVERGWGLSRRSRLSLSTPQLPITTAQQFPTLSPELPPGKRKRHLAAGLGVVVFEGPQGRGFMKGGHNDSTGNSLVSLEATRACVLLMSNDVRAEAAFPFLVRGILGETGVPYEWEYGLPVEPKG